jgi:hypothetical protein
VQPRHGIGPESIHPLGRNTLEGADWPFCLKNSLSLVTMCSARALLSYLSYKDLQN